MTDPSTRERVEWDEVQRAILRGYPKLPWAHFLFLRVLRRADAARYLGLLFAEEWVKFGWGDRHHVKPVNELRPIANVAVSREGLEAFGLPKETIDGFSPEFVEGMTAPSRARVLRDVDASAPETWLWGGPGNSVHLVVMIYAPTESSLTDALAWHRSRLSAAGLEEVRDPRGGEIGASRPLDGRREHFGFADGISQPRFHDEPEGVRVRTAQAARDADRLVTGEILLGYANEAKIFPRSPKLAPPAPGDPSFARPDGNFGKNGSYLVFRQLEQKVEDFWRSMGQLGESGELLDRVYLASKIVGRWPDGSPLTTRSQPGDPDGPGAEDFEFARDDPHGQKCPFGAHIRRANPRSTLARDPEMGLAKSKKHRILRRGRSYGLPYAEPLSPEALVRAVEEGTGRPGPRGLHFLCFNADIANQFEFIQQTWCNGPIFGALHGEVDPLIGDPSVTGGLFTIPKDPLRMRVHGLPRFVEVRGGAYLFVPSKAALEYLSRLS